MKIYTAGTVYGPNDSDMYTAGIDIKYDKHIHWAAIECHSDRIVN